MFLSRPEHNNLVKKTSVPRNPAANSSEVHIRSPNWIQNPPSIHRPPGQPIHLLQQNPKAEVSHSGAISWHFCLGLFFSWISSPHSCRLSCTSTKKATHRHRGVTQGMPRQQEVWEPPKQSNNWGIAALSKKKGGRIRSELRKFYWGNEIVFTRRSQCSHFRKSQSWILISHDQTKLSTEPTLNMQARLKPTHLQSWWQVSEHKSVSHWIQKLHKGSSLAQDLLLTAAECC